MLMIVLMQKALMHVSNFGHFARLFIFFQYFCSAAKRLQTFRMLERRYLLRAPELAEPKKVATGTQLTPGNLQSCYLQKGRAVHFRHIPT